MNEEKFTGFLEKEFLFSKGKGIGDDCSVVQAGDLYQLITSDILIEDIHFSLDYFTFDEIALKSVAVNLSDIAAMGGTAEYFYLNLGFPLKKYKTNLLNFFSGIKKACNEWNIELAGGDISDSSNIIVSITMVGAADCPVMRSGANYGDLICITGETGGSYAGLKLLKKKLDLPRFIKKHKFVEPELNKGKILKNYVSSMIDISDGLIKDLKRILDASGLTGCALHYEKIPVSAELRNLCKKYDFDEYKAVLSGGEDYVLLFTIESAREKQLRSKLDDYFIIGSVDKVRGISIDHQGKKLEIETMGFDHFD